MKTRLFTALAALALITGPQAAQAVDVINEDANPYSLSFAYAGDPDQVSESFGILPQGTVKELCQGCRITMSNGDTIDAVLNEVVLIRDGKLQLAPKTN